MRKSKGSIVWTSSGAARGAYAAWSAYGSGKAAANHIIAHLAVEEPEITSIAIAPGKVDTDMQKLIRETGQEAMSAKDHALFVSEHESGQLVKPEQSGAVLANFALRPDTSLNGKFFKYALPHEETRASLTRRSWNGPELAAYREDA